VEGFLMDSPWPLCQQINQQTIPHRQHIPSPIQIQPHQTRQKHHKLIKRNLKSVPSFLNVSVLNQGKNKRFRFYEFEIVDD
jgi:hypothetical protein